LNAGIFGFLRLRDQLIWCLERQQLSALEENAETVREAVDLVVGRSPRAGLHRGWLDRGHRPPHWAPIFPHTGLNR
jgi:hypothetical protein